MEQIDSVPGIVASPSNCYVQDNLFGDPEIIEPRRVSRRSARGLVAAGKHFVLDTNVLLHDPTSLGRFGDNHVWIPVDVLAELDRFKNEQSDRGANARAANRFLVECFSGHREGVTTGVPTAGGGTLRLAVCDLSKRVPELERFKRIFPDLERVDHRILASMILMRRESAAPVILVTKDLNLQLKAMAVGLQCEDYLSDKVEARDVESYDPRVIEVHPHELQRFASSGELDLGAGRVSDVSANEYVLLCAADRKTIPARMRQGGVFRRLALPESLHIPRGIALRPANLGQQCFLDALLDPAISLVTCYGQAGTGKTLLAVAAGLHMVFSGQHHGVTVSRPVVAMGETLGFLPGTLDEKMRPWLQPIYDALDLLMPPPAAQHPSGEGRKGKKYKEHGGHAHPVAQPLPGASGQPPGKPYDALVEQGVLEIEALCYIRGRSIPRRYFVLDEAQQLTPLEAKTVVTRMSKGSKLVLVGDPCQIDNPYVDSRSNGLVYTRNRMKGQAVAAHVSLSKGERSALAELGARLM